MRLLYLIDSIGVPGGAEESLAALAPEYQRLGIEMTVAVLHDRPGHQDAFAAAGAEVVVLRGESRSGWVRSAVAMLGLRRPDLVHTTLFEADLVGRVAATVARVPLVSSLVNEAYGSEHYADPSLSRRRLRAAHMVDALTAQSVARMHAVSHQVAAVMADRLHYPRSRIDVVPRGRSAERLGLPSPERRARTRAALGLSPEALMLLAVARQEHQKGLDVAVGALADLLRSHPGSVLVVAGRAGGHTDALVAAVNERELQGHVRFLGTRSDVAELLCAADAFVMPSRREGLPGALLEAMALEVPAVVSDLPQVREVVDDSEAWIVPVDDPVAVAAAVRSVASSSTATAERTARARQRFLGEFEIGPIAERMLGFYEWALTEPRWRSWGRRRR